MEIQDICYTPIDAKTVENLNVDDVRAWVEETVPQTHISGTIAKGAHNTLRSRYPWNICYAYLDRAGGWQNNFDVKFPELADSFTSSFGLQLSDISGVLLLPKNELFSGLGVWHSDPDIGGLRMYLENKNFEKNPLYYKKSKVARTGLNTLGTATDNDPRFHEEMHVCKILKENQAFYLNNMQGVHSPFIDSSCQRFAVIISAKNGDTSIIEKTKQLIIDSAIKYKDYALIY